MKREVLVVCSGNAGRSPMVEGFINDTARRDPSKNIHASSAGVNVALEGKEYRPADSRVVALMAQEGIDLGGHLRRQITPQMVHRADIVLVLLTKEEMGRSLPQYLRGSEKVENRQFPDFADAPAGGFVEARDRARRIAKEFVEALA